MASDRPIRVITFQYPFWVGEYQWHGIPVWACGGQNRGGWFRLRTWWRVWQAFRRYRLPDAVVHAFWLGECSWLGALLARLYKMPFLANLQGQDCLPDNPYLKWFKKFPIHIISISNFGAKILHQHTGLFPLKIIPYGIDLLIQNIDNQLDKIEWEILGVGNLIPVKDYFLFIEIIDELRKEFPKIRAAIIGDGVEKASLLALIESRNLRPNLTLLGALPRQEVLGHMSRSRLFLHTSRHEGQGFVFMEALAAGAHVVAFPVGHLPDTPRSHPCTDRKDMLHTIQQILRNPSQPERVQLPTMQATALAYEAVYQEILAG